MKIAVVCASKYGSAMEAGEWIAQRLILDGMDAEAMRPADARCVDCYDALALGSGLYAHKMLGEMDDFIDANLDSLRQKHIALFALAMKREPVFAGGEAHGGLAHLDYLFRKLGKCVLHADMLSGEMAFARLDDSDQKGLEAFYKMLALSEAEIAERKKPRTLMSKQQCWEFAESFAARLRKAARVEK